MNRLEEDPLKAGEQAGAARRRRRATSSKKTTIEQQEIAAPAGIRAGSNPAFFLCYKTRAVRFRRAGRARRHLEHALGALRRTRCHPALGRRHAISAPPPAVLDAMRERLEHGVLGYTTPPPGAARGDRRAHAAAATAGASSRRGSSSSRAWCPDCTSPRGSSCRPTSMRSCRARSITTLKRAPQAARRALTRCAARAASAGAGCLTRSAAASVRPRPLLFLCNPQNPGGTVFTRAELERLAEFTGDARHRAPTRSIATSCSTPASRTCRSRVSLPRYRGAPSRCIRRTRRSTSRPRAARGRSSRTSAAQRLFGRPSRARAALRLGAWL